MSGMKYGPKANAETERAFQLDPNNAQAFAVIGRKYYFAPSMFGGDLNKAIESFGKRPLRWTHTTTKRLYGCPLRTERRAIRKMPKRH